MTRLSLHRRALLVVASVALLCSHASAAPRAERVGREFKVKVGRAVTFGRETLRLRFARVAADSRCPTGVDCVWAGNAEVLVEVSAGGARGRRTLSLNTNAGGERPVEVKYRRYTVRLVALSPYPQSARKIRQGEYVATLLVTESEARP
jgi:hypothetical protein